MPENYSVELRRDLAAKARKYAEDRDLEFYPSLNRREADKTILFVQDEHYGSHGNFLNSSFTQILANKAWLSRLAKRHSQPLALPEEHRAKAKELDSSNSSDALLMNIFCYPDVGTTNLLALLRMSGWEPPCFGVKCLLPGEREKRPTELDMVIGKVSFEAKLTEHDFTSKIEKIVRRYNDLSKVFDVESLQQSKGKFASYQLIRNVLAAHQQDRRLVLLCDSRRPDLIQHWERIRERIRDSDLQARCGQISWQQIAARVPAPLQKFLENKYGIEPDGSWPIS
jgi:hypothetical protein